MQPPENYEEIPNEKVAVRDWSAFSAEEQESRLDIGWYEVYGQKPPEYLALIDSLEIRIIPEDIDLVSKPIEFDWVISSYTESFIDI